MKNIITLTSKSIRHAKDARRLLGRYTDQNEEHSDN